LIDKFAHAMHSDYHWYVSDQLGDAPTGSWGNKDGYLFERLGDLAVDAERLGIEVPSLKEVKRSPFWMRGTDVKVGDWTVKGNVGGLVMLEVNITFSYQHSYAVFLSDYSEVQMQNLAQIGTKLAALHDQSRQAWRLSDKWVFKSLKVASGFLVQSREKGASVTITGHGKLPAKSEHELSLMPISVDTSSFLASQTSTVAVTGLENISPFVTLCEVRDPWGHIGKADWREID
jgi:hypothetical protein